MKDRILLAMPTRGRPFSALEAIASVMRTAADPSSVLIRVGQDEDDLFQFELYGCSGVQCHLAPAQSFAPWVNWLTNASQGFTWCAWFADDIRFRTPGWDDKLRSHSEDIVYGDDGHHHGNLATHPFVRADIVRALGFLAHPRLFHYYHDNFIQDLGKELGSIAYAPGIVTEHLHPDTGKSKSDALYDSKRSHMSESYQIYQNEIKPRMPAYALGVRGYRALNHA